MFPRRSVGGSDSLPLKTREGWEEIGPEGEGVDYFRR